MKQLNTLHYKQGDKNDPRALIQYKDNILPVQKIPLWR